MNDPCPVDLRGIVPSLNTPFLDNGNLDTTSLRRLIDHTVKSGCAGMLALAVAGEQASLSITEKVQFLEVAAAHNQNRIPLIISVTSPHFDESLFLAKHAYEAGAAGICYQPPAGSSRTNLYELLAQLSDVGPEILMIQDLDWVGGGMEVPDIVKLFDELPKFQCLKIETVPAGPKYTEVIEATGGRLHVSGGWAVSQLMDALGRGVHAFIPTGMEAVYVALYRLYQAGDHEQARTLFNQLLPILAFSNQHIDISIQFFKKARRAESLFSSDVCRSPKKKLDPIQNLECENALSQYLELHESMRS